MKIAAGSHCSLPTKTRPQGVHFLAHKNAQAPTTKAPAKCRVPIMVALGVSMVFHGRLRARNLAQRARLLHGLADECHRRRGHRIPQLVVQPVRVPLPLPLQHEVLRKALHSTARTIATV